MNTEEKNRLNHDFLNSAVIINSLSKSAATFIDKIADREATITEKQMELFKASMSSIQKELAKIESLFQAAINL